jgi:DNA-directed RNA polymerase specialized sigma24 family protein
MVIPLNKTTKNGRPYNRRPQVEKLLKELEVLVPDQLVKRLTCAQQAVPSEVLVYYLRHTELALAAKHLEPIFTVFYSRLEAALRKTCPDGRIAHAAFIRDEITGRVLEMIATDRNTPIDQMYYWEINFNHALANLRKDVLRELGPARKTDPLINAEPLTQNDSDGDEIRPEVDIAAADFFNSSPSILDDQYFRMHLMDAISNLPEDERRAVGLLLQGMQIDSQNPEVMTIAKALECTEKTVRNRLQRAYKTLRVVLQKEHLL